MRALQVALGILQFSLCKLEYRTDQLTIADGGCSIEAAAGRRVTLPPGLSRFLIILIVLPRESITLPLAYLFGHLRQGYSRCQDRFGDPDTPRTGKEGCVTWQIWWLQCKAQALRMLQVLALHIHDD